MECCNDIILAFVASILSTLLGAVILYLLKPNLDIEKLYIEEGKIKVKVVNKGCSAAINLKVEVCTVKGKDITNHFEIDREDFLILPHTKKAPDEKNRIFKAKLDGKIEEKIKEPDTSIRVRVYAAHAYSGFGKVFQKKFQYNAKTETFSLVKN